MLGTISLMGNKVSTEILLEKKISMTKLGHNINTKVEQYEVMNYGCTSEIHK